MIYSARIKKAAISYLNEFKIEPTLGTEITEMMKQCKHSRPSKCEYTAHWIYSTWVAACVTSWDSKSKGLPVMRRYKSNTSSTVDSKWLVASYPATIYWPRQGRSSQGQYLCQSPLTSLLENLLIKALVLKLAQTCNLQPSACTHHALETKRHSKRKGLGILSCQSREELSL